MLRARFKSVAPEDGRDKSSSAHPPVATRLKPSGRHLEMHPAKNSPGKPERGAHDLQPEARAPAEDFARVNPAVLRAVTKHRAGRSARAWGRSAKCSRCVGVLKGSKRDRGDPAIRLRPPNGGTPCTGCPHPHWAVWAPGRTIKGALTARPGAVVRGESIGSGREAPVPGPGEGQRAQWEADAGVAEANGNVSFLPVTFISPGFIVRG